MSAQTTRLPASAVASFAAHAGALGLFVFLKNSQPQTTHVVANVDLMIQVHKTALPRQTEAVKKAAPKTMMNFLKMALPSVPHAAAPQQLDIKLPDAHKPLMAEAPKLEDRGRPQQLAKIDSIDLNAKHAQLAALSEPLPQEHRAAAALAQLPRLEEVGVRRVRNLPAALALEDRRQQAAALQNLGTLAVPSEHRAGPAPIAALQDAGAVPQPSGLRNKIASFLPDEQAISLKPQAAPQPALSAKMIDAPAPARHQTAALAAKKKGIDIEGPLADRKVVAYEVPAFPDWARDQGILEASVAIRFYVTPAGDVESDDMRVERTSGYGQLDRLAMGSLKKWKFAPLASDERQWGVITFRFVLE